ncbi:MAG: segregation/condensation protein A [Phycisphaerales bacterium]|nr:segregation/condensation protein A [Phycisphaerales bacterium]
MLLLLSRRGGYPAYAASKIHPASEAGPRDRGQGGTSVDDYRVQLDVYSGPMDLLLYLIRREEIDIYDIPIARLTQQYLGYVNLLQRIDPEAVGEFLVLAATLMEIKSRALLPRPPVEEEGAEDWVDPRMELVRQLLQYKTYKDAARALEWSARIQSLKHPRQPITPETPESEIDLEDVEVWRLLEAFQRLLDETGQGEAFHQVAVDDTPIALYAEDILDSLERAGGVQAFSDIFAGRVRAEMIGLFLALLELIRERRVQAKQDAPLACILLYLLDATPIYGAMEAHAHGDASDEASVAVIRPAEWGKGIPDSRGQLDESEAVGLMDDDEPPLEDELDESFRLPESKEPMTDWDGEATAGVLRISTADLDDLGAPAPAARSDVTGSALDRDDGAPARNPSTEHEQPTISEERP